MTLVPKSPPRIELDRVSKYFSAANGRVVAVEQASFSIQAGEFITIVGPSGCGKTTIFNMIAGLLEPSAGSICIDGQSCAGKTGRVGYMLQKDLLLPWRTVLQNVMLGAELLNRPRREVEDEARRLMARFGLSGFEMEWPAKLSGGMRQRAALMRTVLSHQEVMLLDEPFGALDAMTKAMMQEWLLDIWSEFNRTIVFITHDIDEAIYLADRVFVMSARPGSIKREVRVDLPRPRYAQDITTTPEFGRIKHEVLEAIRDEIRAAYGVSAVNSRKVSS
jgi:ABC-type nitrate/sulfonate/bicarbonate transport system ATPase subunit